jgi:hypothetical protein
MLERRSEPRITAVDVVTISWEEGLMTRQQLGNIQNLSLSGVGILIDHELAVGTHITMSFREGKSTGIVRHCTELVDRYFIGVEFFRAAGTTH